MKRTVKKWVKFLNTDKNQKFVFQAEGGLKATIRHYKAFDDFISTHDEYWLEQPVIKV